MTRSGADYIEGLRDGRRVFIDGELVDDVTTHPAFREVVRSVASLYDMTNDPAERKLMTFAAEGTGDPASLAWLIPRSEADLIRRHAALRRWSEQSGGFLGRGPDHVAGFLAGFAGNASFFASGGPQYGENVRRFYDFAVADDLYTTYTIVPPQIDRSKPPSQQAEPNLHAGVHEERDDGIVVRGAQMLGTGTAIADWVLLSCIHPLRPGDEDYAISVMVPVGAPGLKVYSRRSYAQAATSTFDYPLSARFDETDSWLVFDDVFVPWENVFIYRDVELASKQWFSTSGHVLGNNQAQVRLSVKLDFLVGIAYRVAEMNGVGELPPVKGALGELASYAAMINGLVAGAEHNCWIDEDGVARPGGAESFAVMSLQSSVYPELLTKIRELCGGGLIQQPSSVADFENPEIAADIARYMRGAEVEAEDKVKLQKLAWDAVGSEFAGRHTQYEMFYAGQPFAVRGRMYEHYDFERASGLVESLMAGYDLKGRK